MAEKDLTIMKIRIAPKNASKNRPKFPKVTPYSVQIADVSICCPFLFSEGQHKKPIANNEL
jgi:hypothetical protein